MIRVDQKAPDFIAPAVQGDTAVEFELYRIVEASDALVVYFYPADFVPTCTAELCAMRDAEWAETGGLSVVGVRSDSLYAGFAYADRFGIPFPLVRDDTGSIAESYGLLAASWEGHTDVPRRGVVVIGGDWTVEFVDVTADPLDRRSPAPVENATEALQRLGVDAERPRVDYEGPW